MRSMREFDAAAALRPQLLHRLRRGLRLRGLLLLLPAAVEQIVQQAAGLLREGKAARGRETTARIVQPRSVRMRVILMI